MATSLVPPAADLRLWQRFQSGKVTDLEIAGNRTLQRWERSRRAGVVPDSPAEPIVNLEGLAEAIQRFAPLLAPGAPFDAFATEMAKAGFCGLLTDDRGVILSQRMPESFRKESIISRLQEGAVWSEQARGTNGMGTALVEQTPLSIVGTEHYEQRNHSLACFAAPIRDIRKRVVAILDASGPVASASPFVQASVVATAAALEALIIARTYDAAVPGGLFELERLLERLPHASILVESTGHLRRANARFHGLLPVARSEDLGWLVRSRLGRSSERPRDAVDMPGSLQGYAIELEPIGASEDPFAAIVHLRAKSQRSAVAHTTPGASRAFEGILGHDPGLEAARSRAERIARTDLPVLILGESGVGKETLARAIHAASARARSPFVVLNVASSNRGPIETEMFGSGDGTEDAPDAKSRPGRLEAARGGTLFIDEIGDLDASEQAQLMRFLEHCTFTRAGELIERRADVRVIAASRLDLADAVARDRFRKDLYFRLRGAVLRLPALRERTDRRELAEGLLSRIASQRELPKPLGLSPGALQRVESGRWPGNVRELVASLEYAVVLAADSPRVERWHLPADDEEPAPKRGDLRSAAERSAVAQALERSRGNLSEAARSLGVARSTLYRMIHRHGLVIEGDASKE